MSYEERASARHPKNDLLEFVWYTDGVQTWSRRGNGLTHLERYVGNDGRVSTKRRKWCLVDRNDYGTDGLCPPIVVGPFDNVKVALLALELLGDQR